MFRHKLLSVDEIVQDFSATVERLLRANPNVKFVFTVSPVRHTREGTRRRPGAGVASHLRPSHMPSPRTHAKGW